MYVFISWNTFLKKNYGRSTALFFQQKLEGLEYIYVIESKLCANIQSLFSRPSHHICRPENLQEKTAGASVPGDNAPREHRRRLQRHTQ